MLGGSVFGSTDRNDEACWVERLGCAYRLLHLKRKNALGVGHFNVINARLNNGLIVIRGGKWTVGS